MSQPRVVFFGAPAFVVPTLEALVAAEYPVVAVISGPNQRVGRHRQLVAPPVVGAAIRLGVPVEQPLKLAALANRLRELRPLVGVLFAYGRLLPKAVVAAFPHGILNIHPSLLPRYRGPSPVAQAIRDGATETGVSVMVLDEQMDHGPVLAQRATTIAPSETAEQLTARLARLGTLALFSVLPPYVAGTLTPVPQSETGATYTRSMTRDDGAVNWQHPAAHIYNQYRALQPWPGLFTWWNQRRLKLLDVVPLAGLHEHGVPGQVAIIGGTLAVFAGSGALAIHRLQVEGKAAVAADAWLRGHPQFARTVLRSQPPPAPSQSPAGG